MGSDTNSVIDLRSDVLAPPTEEMWKAMREVDLGWSMLGEDRSVKELEALGAEMLGKEEAIFVPTCSIANLLTLMTLGKRGTQVVLEAKSHIACLEHWNVAYICGLFSRLIEGIHGIMNPVTVDEVISEAKYFGLPGTSVVCLENSHNNAGGTIVTAEQIENIAEITLLDIMPCAARHTLVVPKLEVKRLEDLPEAQALSLMRTLQHVAKAISADFDGIDYNLILNNGINAGQEMEHVHFHVLPRPEGSPRPFRQRVQYAEVEMQEVGAKIRIYL
jgi:diadenosine tetraphosphate (Ap4A) HIT family hydrolase